MPTLNRRQLVSALGATFTFAGGALSFSACRPPPEDTGERPKPDSGDSGDTGPVPPEGYNVLYISSDEHNPKLMGCEGHADSFTPNIDRLAAEGVLFHRAYTVAPVCAPNRQSMLTGLYPQEHGQYGNEYVFNELNETLADHFTRQGFATACYGKLHTQNDEETFTFGFDTLLSTQSGARWDAVWDAAVAGVPEAVADPEHEKMFAEMPYDFNGAKPLEDLHRSDDWVILQEALAWLKAHKDERFFLYVSFRAPHFPFYLPTEFYYLFDPDSLTLPDVVEGDLEDSRIGEYWAETYGWPDMTEAQTRLVLALYQGAISWVDHLVGELLQALEDLGLDQRTLVAYTSDHGDMAGEKGLWLKGSFFEGACRKPFILRMPGVLPAGTRSELLLSEVDLWPSIAGLVGAAADLPDIRGQDLSAFMLGEQEGAPTLLFSFYGVNDWASHPWLMMARDSRYKLVRYRAYTSDKNAYELYDLELDPFEHDNVYADSALSEKRAELEAAMDAVLASMREPSYPPVKDPDADTE